MNPDLIAIAKKCYQAFVDKDRQMLESLIAPDFHFTSPLDNRLDRATFFDRCWPNSQSIAAFEYENIAAQGDRVCVTYVGTTVSGGRFKNTELLTVRNGKIVDAEVFFGWSLPHEAPENGFIDAPSKA